MAKRTYSQEEVDAIFARAIEQQAKDSQSLTHEELVNAASEVGISREAIDAAEAELRDAGARQDENKSDQDIVRSHKRRARLAFARHFIVYVLVNALLAFINLATSAHFLWFLIVMLGWGIGIAMHLMGVAFPDEERIVEHARRREGREQERRARRLKKHGMKREDFEAAVNEGVKLLIEASHKTRVDPGHEPKARVRADDDPDEEDAEESAQLRKRT